MPSKRILLSIPEPIMKKLKHEMELYAFTSLQDVIIDALRNKFYFQLPRSTTKKGRPRKLDEMKILTRKKIFSKHGERISV